MTLEKCVEQSQDSKFRIHIWNTGTSWGFSLGWMKAKIHNKSGYRALNHTPSYSSYTAVRVKSLKRRKNLDNLTRGSLAAFDEICPLRSYFSLNLDHYSPQILPRRPRAPSLHPWNGYTFAIYASHDI